MNNGQWQPEQPLGRVGNNGQPFGTPDMRQQGNDFSDRGHYGSPKRTWFRAEQTESFRRREQSGYGHRDDGGTGLFPDFHRRGSPGSRNNSPNKGWNGRRANDRSWTRDQRSRERQDGDSGGRSGADVPPFTPDRQPRTPEKRTPKSKSRTPEREQEADGDAEPPDRAGEIDFEAAEMELAQEDELVEEPAEKPTVSSPWPMSLPTLHRQFLHEKL